MAARGSSIYVTIFGNAKPLTRSLGRAQADLGRFGKSVASSSGLAGGAFAGLGAAAGIAAVATGKAFLDFDDQMTKSVSIMGDVSDDLRKDMERTARSVAKSSTYGAGEAAEAYFFLASAGLDASQSMEALPKVSRFAQAGAFNLARATDLLTDTQSALGLTVDDTTQNMANMNRVSDVLVRANTLANATVEQFSESLTNKAGAALKVVGKDIEEGVAVLAAFADQGIKGAEAGTALGIVMRDMQTKAIANRDAWSELGVAVFDTEGEMRNMGTIVSELETALLGMSDEQKKVTLAQLGFSDKSVGFVQTILGQGEAIGEYEAKLRSAGGATDEVAEKQLGSFKNKLKLNLIAPLQDAAITVGQSFVPALTGAGSAVTGIVPYIENFAAGLEVVIGFISGLPGPVKIAALAIGGLALAMKALSASPIIAGLTVAAGLIAAIGADANKAKDSTNSLVSILESVGASGVTRWLEEQRDGFHFLDEALANTDLTYGDFLDAIRSSDGTFDDHVDAILAVARENDELSGNTAELKEDLEQLRTAYQDATTTVEAQAEADRRARTDAISHKDALLEQLHAVEGLTGVTMPLNTQLGYLAKTQEEVHAAGRKAAEAILFQHDAAIQAANPMHRLWTEMENVQRAQQAVNELQEQGKEGTDEYVTAVLDLAKSNSALDATQAEVAVNLGSSSEAFRQQLEAIGLNNDQIGALIRRIKDYNDLDIDSKTFNFNVTGETPGRVITTSGGGSRALFHRGGVVGKPHSNEVDARLEKGEVVRTARQEQALAKRMAQPARQGPITVVIELDKREIGRAMVPEVAEQIRIKTRV